MSVHCDTTTAVTAGGQATAILRPYVTEGAMVTNSAS